MSESLPLAPVWLTDVAGSALMIIFSFLAVRYAVRLRKAQPSHIIWTYLLWLSVALAAFAISRGVGHIAKRGLLVMDKRDVWVAIRPFSGAVNTLAFIVVGSITLFFQRAHRINSAILADEQALEQASREVMRLNRHLEALVKQRTEELSSSEQKYRRIFQDSMDMVFILDSQGQFLDINRAGLDTLGYQSGHEVVGKLNAASLFVSQEDYEAMMRELDLAGFVTGRECRIAARDGSELRLLVSATATRDPDGSVLSYEGIAKDITARVGMERQLQRADKLASLGQISTGIAHEVNNPLGVILGYTQLLLRSEQAGTQLYDDLKTIEKHARNCKGIVEDLLKFARGTSTKKDSVDICATIEDVLSLFGHQLELDNISVETLLESGLPTIMGDEEKLKQVFVNLLVNAKQAIRRNGRIAIWAQSQACEGFVRISISDTGNGISPDVLDKIFDPFFTTKPVGEGTGLGLSVSYGIIQDHNGRIEVESVPGQGSTFTILLPVLNGKQQVRT